MQSEALLHAYRGWRRQWGEDRRCGGALVWQLNDCWPATSWGIVDYYLRKKPSFYTVTRSLRSISVGVQRQHHDWSVCHARPAKISNYTVWIASSKLHESKVDFELRFVSVKSGKDIKSAIIKKDIIVNSNGTTHIVDDEIDNVNEEPHVVAARLLVDGVCISRDVDWPQPFKYLSFQDRGVEVRQSGDSYIVTASKPTKGVVFEERDGVQLSDNCLDIIPGDEQTIEAKGLSPNTEPFAWRYLGVNEQ
jgi:beta-mannosidase